MELNRWEGKYRGVSHNQAKQPLIGFWLQKQSTNFLGFVKSLPFSDESTDILPDALVMLGIGKNLNVT